MSYPINLEHLRKEAKTILKQCRAGNTASIERVRLQLPKLALLDTRGVAEQTREARQRARGCLTSPQTLSGLMLCRRRWTCRRTDKVDDQGNNRQEQQNMNGEARSMHCRPSKEP